MRQIKERRITELLKRYWNDVRGDRPYPPESEIDPEALSSIWDSCFLVRVDRGNAERPHHYAYLGAALVRAYGGEDASAREVCEALVYPSAMSMIHKFREVAEGGVPVQEAGEFRNPAGEVIKYRSELLPLGDREGGIGYIIGGMKWKVF